MLHRGSIGALAWLAVLCATIAVAQAFDEAKYPDWRGQWGKRFVADFGPNPSWDPNKFEGLAQQAPLTPEYQTLLEASIADQATGGAGLDRDYVCLPAGMPRMMNVYGTMEILVMPDTTYILMSAFNDTRRIYTDGREWPADLQPSYAGYSIGRWIDTQGTGRFDVLEIETRGFRGPRTLDSTAIPLHADNQTVVKERLFSDLADRNILHDEITLIDHAFTHPWTVTKDFRRSPQPRPVWLESTCEDNAHIRIGTESYMLSPEGLLMPTKKDQATPDLRYFNKARR
jgi:hypothetical protein